MFLILKYLGTDFLPRLYSVKAAVDLFLERVPGLPDLPADRLLHWLAKRWPDHLPKRMRSYRNEFEHHLVVVGADAAIPEIREVLQSVTRDGDAGSFFRMFA